MARTNISVDRAVFEQFAGVARKQDKSLFAFANEILSTLAGIYSEGGDVRELHRLWQSFSLIKNYVDVLTLPSDFVDEMIRRLYASDREGTLRMFGDLGKQLVGVLKMVAPDMDRLTEMAQEFIVLLPVKTFRVSRREGGEIQVDIIGAWRKVESAECTAEFVRSLLSGYGFDVSAMETMVGLVRLKATSRETTPAGLPVA
ncbi:MAG: hypothetical protein JRN39_04585 [Nitrososphaerota archaeon]|nr:hypothetical protein [Nitrososphaerota archaeon]MDG6939662.1 hypothetical protein [Nitrososphaerota archaeon]